jgi:hypothetical protein
MDDASARKYVATLGTYSSITPVTLSLDLEIVQDVARLHFPSVQDSLPTVSVAKLK